MACDAAAEFHSGGMKEIATMRGRRRMLLTAMAIAVSFLAQGCAHKTVRCDGRLSPINLPASPGQGATTSAALKESPLKERRR